MMRQDIIAIVNALQFPHNMLWLVRYDINHFLIVPTYMISDIETAFDQRNIDSELTEIDYEPIQYELIRHLLEESRLVDSETEYSQLDDDSGFSDMSGFTNIESESNQYNVDSRLIDIDSESDQYNIDL